MGYDIILRTTFWNLEVYKRIQLWKMGNAAFRDRNWGMILYTADSLEILIKRNSRGRQRNETDCVACFLSAMKTKALMVH